MAKEDKSFENEYLFKSFIETKFADNKLVVLGGHFVLMYNHITNRLEPAIYQDYKDPILVEIAKTIAGEFPLSTFDLAQYFCERHNASQVLLVNDHYFKKQPNYFEFSDIESWGKYRKKYYSESVLPTTYLNSIKSNSTSHLSFVENPLENSAHYNKYLWSETSLRKRFDKKTKERIAQVEGFEQKLTNGINELYFTKRSEVICVSEFGSCGCSGEVIQLLIELSKNEEVLNLLLMVPVDCYDLVSVGVESFLHYYSFIKSNKKLIKIAISTGFGDSYILNSDHKINMRIYHGD